MRVSERSCRNHDDKPRRMSTILSIFIAFVANHCHTLGSIDNAIHRPPSFIPEVVKSDIESIRRICVIKSIKRGEKKGEMHG